MSYSALLPQSWSTVQSPTPDQQDRVGFLTVLPCRLSLVACWLVLTENGTGRDWIVVRSI